MWNSGWIAWVAAPRKRASSCSTVTWSPFHISVPSKSMSSVTTSGGVGGGGGLPTGMLSFTACVWMGIVMISMMSSTSITSMSGVVLMSTITSGSPDPPVPTVIAMNLLLGSAAHRAHRGLGDEADLEDRGALGRGHHFPHGLETGLLVGADVDLGLRHHHRD